MYGHQTDAKLGPSPGQGVAIDVDKSGNPWVVNHQGLLYSKVADTWTRQSDDTLDIGIGTDAAGADSIYRIGIKESRTYA